MCLICYHDGFGSAIPIMQPPSPQALSTAENLQSHVPVSDGNCNHQSNPTDVLQTDEGKVDIGVASIHIADVTTGHVRQEKMKQEKEPAPLTPEKCDIVDKEAMDLKPTSADIIAPVQAFSSSVPVATRHSKSGDSDDCISKPSRSYEIANSCHEIGSNGCPVLNSTFCI